LLPQLLDCGRPLTRRVAERTYDNLSTRAGSVAQVGDRQLPLSRLIAARLRLVGAERVRNPLLDRAQLTSHLSKPLLRAGIGCVEH